MYIIYVAHFNLSTKALLPFIIQLTPKWYELGAMLLEEKQEAHLRAIKTSHSGDAWKCCFDMLQYWMETHPEATWDHLVTALKSPGVELIAVASDIEKSLAGKVLI